MPVSSFQSPSLVPSVKDQIAHVISDDECMSRLARAVAEHDDRRLNEVAELIGRLAVPIE
ncbi:MAG: putative transcriptional regulator [Afipia broomeae]|jgi:predicted transcriptional regulator|uniref:Uncharacterized protein n=1 Tax=Afipia broomeae ATCC 49717 TaxID=883078 RepID=K8PJ53_9BRAD|nr:MULTISPECIES: hypothetical protein [Afipia]MAH69769.1 hypothetical protein [Afipia sp.]OUX61182.1 MAG: hypothetical protein CBB64_11050 [Afipia sp. TMED4]RTL83105.1 MAG: hypothetical protein EKK35_03180 [Bradyrhizobiaceae bacterium]EKS38393.1 hypothetical protein HMPREF9695_02233 [Afipia broomeae ATCC 49717]HAO41906.1 hypothetical protein [Afipia sp.]|tara:strand:- start:452 stop:631 length:180 start_codon:yes stop_codon:yes gene_type:complete